MRLLAVLLASCAIAAAEMPALIPMPCRVTPAQGTLTLPPDVGISTADPADAARLISVLGDFGLKAHRVDGGGTVTLMRGEVENPHHLKGAYRIDISDKGVVVTAADGAGAFYAAETFRQLISLRGAGASVPAVSISDWPAFQLRGFMLDVGRNYQSPELIREQLEVMARYKFNVFHFHFTDNPGWRLESKVHPEVDSPASMSRLSGKLYTQQEFKDIVAFCKERHITVIPEMDMPGHSIAFRKALGISSMNDPATRKFLKELLTELASLVPKEDMPYIHLGTDEAHGAEEKTDATFLPEMSAHVRSLGREVIGWRPGIEDPADKKRITHLWSSSKQLPENPFLDSRSTYLNHVDPFEMISCLLFQQPCRVPHGDDRALGGILCSWPDIRIENERDQLKQNPVYPAMLTYGESIWRGVDKDDREAYWANLPPPGTPEFDRLREFEGRLLNHKERFFKEKEFPYLKQTDLRWKIIGPFPSGGDVARAFPVENQLLESYELDGKSYRWMDREFAAATVHLRHFFGFGAPVKEAEGTCYALTHIWSPKDQAMPAWIGFDGPSRSDWRSGNQFIQGEWHPTRPWCRVNGQPVAPPQWDTRPRTSETALTNEDYFYREPSTVQLRKGWNEVLLKIPHRRSDWKWMFTFIPVGDTTGLRYTSELSPK